MSEFDWRTNKAALLRGPAVDLLAAKMATLKRQMVDEMNRDLFRDMGGPSIPLPPLTWRQRLRRRVDRVRGYFAILWAALKGDDPYDVDHEDW